MKPGAVVKNLIKDAKSESGQAIVEFALALPLLLTILCGIMDFGWIFSNQYKVEYAAYNGARYASINAPALESAGEIEQSVAAVVADNLDGGTVTVSADTSAKKVTVEVEYPVKTLTFVAGTIYGDYYSAEASKTASY